jgi:hypothetical protein
MIIRKEPITFYIQTSDGAYRSYVGMDISTVNAMLTAQKLSYTLMTEEQYNITVQSLKS